jgi:hypothetical protein
MTQEAKRPGQCANTAEPESNHFPSQDAKMNSTGHSTGGVAMPVSPTIMDATMVTGPSPEYYAAWAKCRELGKQLSLALAETGDNEFAYIRPAGIDFAVGFGSLGEGHSSLIELPVDRVNRFAAQLSLALDDWSDNCNIPWIAHVHGASTGRGVWFQNAHRTIEDRDGLAIAALVARCEKALAAWDAADDIENDDPINIELEASRRALLDFRPTSVEGFHRKANAMLALRSIAEWDDLDREELIRAFIDGKAVQA